MSRYRTGFLYALTGTTVFSFTLPMVKLALPSFDPWTITFTRLAIAGLTALAIVSLRRTPWPQRNLWPAIAVTGFGISIGFPICSTLAMQRTTSAHGAVIIASLPLATAVFAVLSHRERVAPVFWAGAVTGVSALAVYAWHHGGSEGGDVVADVLLVLAVLSSAMGYSEGVKLMRHMPGWQVVSWCVILYLPVSLVGAGTAYVVTHADYAVSAQSVAALLFISFGSMYLGFFAWYRGLGDLGVARGSQIQLVQPLLTILWSLVLLGERVSGATLGTALVVLACVATTQRGRRLTSAPAAD